MNGCGTILLNIPVEDLPENVINIGLKVFDEITDAPDGGLWVFSDGDFRSPVEFLTAIDTYAESYRIDYESGDKVFTFKKG